MTTTPPCWADRAAWDLDPDTGTHPPVDQLVDACLTQCPTLDLCRQLDAGDCYGVVAGVHRPWPANRQLTTVAPVHNRIQADLLRTAERMQPGAELPTVDDLARSYGVSTLAVRAALRALAADGVLTSPGTRHQRYRAAYRTETPA